MASSGTGNTPDQAAPSAQASEPAAPLAGQFVVDAQGVVQAWDAGMEAITGLAVAEAVGRPLGPAGAGLGRPWLATFLVQNDLAAAQAALAPEPVHQLPWGGQWWTQARLAGAARLAGTAEPGHRLLEIAARQAGTGAVVETVYRLPAAASAAAAADAPDAPDLEALRILAEHVPVGVALMQEGRLVMVNQSFCAMFGYSNPSELIDQPHESLLVAQDQTRQRQVFQTLDQHQPGQARFEWTGVNRDGRKFWFEGRPTPIVLNGRPAVISFVMDITEFKQREEIIERESQQLRQENQRLRTSIDYRVRLGNIIGRSSKMQEVFEAILRAAASEFGIVIYGETGTGKELVAKAIHALSQRSTKAFVPVNCGALPEELFEAEFFGYRKGSFTGAYADKPGYLDQARGGTLFMDEVAEISPASQVKLLRALGSGEYSAIGSTTPTQADFRVIAATNRDLEGMVRRGAFRRDLFYRVHVIPIHLPPLRERKEDIPYLVEHFLTTRPGPGPARKMVSQDLAKLLDCDWPGNVRELRNTLERYLAFGNLDFMAPGPAAGGPGLDGLLPAGDGELRGALMQVERRLILRALENQGWNRSRTAAALGLPRKTLFRKMLKLGLGAPGEDDLP
ncbi:MAG: sigma 54-interacting transcriptional regulator [Pseudomonadota bacterium]